MNISLAATDEQRLAERAAAHGFASAGDFAREVLTNIASLPAEAVVFAPLDAEQRARSEDILRRGEADLAAGRVRDASEGMNMLGASRGFRVAE